MAVFICQRCEAQHDTWNGACPACGGTELLKVSAPVDRLLGRVVAGRYRILKRLGQGGMGAVYLAEQVGIGQQVAMKFLNSGLSLDPDVARRFLNEAKSYARVAHPNAVTLHDFGQDEEGSLYISMEYVEGDDLKRLLHAAGRLPVNEAVDIMLQVADVLSYAHARQVIHRDLKPENIMVRQGLRGFHVKVLDFGIARITDGATRLTVQGAVAGTPRYMSPEQVMGQDADARADVYSLGIVLFEMLTGKQPFDGTTVPEIMQKQVHQPMPRLEEVAPDLQVPPAIEAVILKATSKNRVERHATMEAFALELSNAVPTLTGRAALNITPIPGAAPPKTPGTLLFGDGTEPTVIRGTPAQGTPRAPIPLTQPAPGARPLSDGLDKTALPAVPAHAAPQRSRAGWVAAAAVGVVMFAAGAGVVFIRGSGPGASPATPTQPAPVPAPPQAPLAEAQVPPPSTETPAANAASAGAQDTDPEPTTPAATVASAGAQAPESTTPEGAPPAPVPTATAPSAEQARQANELVFRAKLELATGNLGTAQAIIDSAPELAAVEPKLAELGTSVSEAAALLQRGDALASEGDCPGAIRKYREVLKRVPKSREARSAISKCQAELPPDIAP